LKIVIYIGARNRIEQSASLRHYDVTTMSCEVSGHVDLAEDNQRYEEKGRRWKNSFSPVLQTNQDKNNSVFINYFTTMFGCGPAGLDSGESMSLAENRVL
jgi:hypothetical protein